MKLQEFNLNQSRERVKNTRGVCISRAMENLEDLFDLNPFLAEIYSSYSAAAADDDDELKMSMNNNWNGQEIAVLRPMNNISSSSTSIAVEAPQIISFENERIFSQTNADHSAVDCNKNIVTPSQSKIINFSPNCANINHDYGMKERVPTATRTPSQAQDHVMAERKRRENISQLFIALSKVVPGLKKLDKASLLQDAINYLKALQERVSALEKEEIVSSRNAPVEVNTSFSCPTDSNCELASAEISVRISDKHVLVKICCKKQMGLMSKIPCELERIHLSVIDMRIMPFGGEALHVTILAEMQNEFNGTVKEIADHLQAVLGSATQI